MKILITGATGFIGKSLLPLLSDKGYEIVAVTRNRQASAVKLPVVCHTVEWNLDKGPPPAEAFEGVNAVVHLAGENVASGRWTEKRKREIRRSRIQSSRLLVDAIASLDRKPEVLISASAVGIYGDRGEETLTENSSTGEGFLAEVCREWEKEILRAQESGVRAVQLRIGVVLGADGGAMKRMLPPFRLGLGGPLGSGKQWMSWIHVKDLARLVLHALEDSPLEGPINAVAPNPVTNRDFSEELGRVLDRPAFFPVPAVAVKLAFGDMSEILLCGQKVSPGKIMESNFEFLYPDLRAALKQICDQRGHELRLEQWIPTPINEIFDFFSDAKNLEYLTPPHLHFKIRKVSTEKMQEGTRLDYRLQLHGVPFHWQSLIADWQPGVRFSDRQTKGPYAYWYHTHEFFEKDGGTVIRDRAVYEVPLWVPGDILLHPFIRKDLEKIFAYRRKKILERFGS